MAPPCTAAHRHTRCVRPRTNDQPGTSCQAPALSAWVCRAGCYNMHTLSGAAVACRQDRRHNTDSKVQPLVAAAAAKLPPAPPGLLCCPACAHLLPVTMVSSCLCTWRSMRPLDALQGSVLLLWCCSPQRRSAAASPLYSVPAPYGEARARRPGRSRCSERCRWISTISWWCFLLLLSSTYVYRVCFQRHQAGGLGTARTAAAGWDLQNSETLRRVTSLF
jgi:hypothetical protein